MHVRTMALRAGGSGLPPSLKSFLKDLFAVRKSEKLVTELMVGKNRLIHTCSV